MKRVLEEAAARAGRYVEASADRRVAAVSVDGLARLGGALADEPQDPAEVVALLDDARGRRRR